MYILITIIFLLGLFSFFIAEVLEDTGCIAAIIGIVLVILSAILLYFKVGADRKKTIDHIYYQGYKTGQIYCINGDMIFVKKLNKENEYVYQKIKEMPPSRKYLDQDYDLYEADKIFERGFKRGQIDCEKGIIEYERITNDDGEVKFRKIESIKN
jgi:hypothetical protein